MSTRRKVKGGAIAPRWRYLSKMFKSVEGYLNWVSDSIVQINKEEVEKKKKEKDLLMKIVAIMLKRARRYSANFDRYIRVDGRKIKEIKQSVKRNLRRRVGNEYVYRLQVKRPRPGVFEVGDQMLAGYPHDVQPEHAIMKLHKQLTIEERGQLRRQVRAILDPISDYISPERMGKWISPALKEALLDIDDSVISKHAIQVMLVHSKEGFFVIFSCLPDTSDKSKLITLKLEVQLSIDVEELPAYFKIPHPYPNKPPYKKRGQAMVKYLKESFEIGELCIKLYSPLAKIVKLPAIKSSPVYKSRSQRILERAQTEVYGKKEVEEDKRTWRIDFESLEKVIYKHVKTEPRFQTIQEAFELYTTLSQCGNKVLPPINQRTRGALSLWLFKQTADTQSTRFETFKYLLMIVDGCLNSKFCPAFIQPKSNTLDPHSGDSRKIMFESSTSDDEEEEEEEGEELDEALPQISEEEEDSEEEDFMTAYRRHRQDLTKPPEEREQKRAKPRAKQGKKKDSKEKGSKEKGSKEKDSKEKAGKEKDTKEKETKETEKESHDKEKKSDFKSQKEAENSKVTEKRNKDISQEKKLTDKENKLEKSRGKKSDGKGGLVIEETSSVLNFDNKTEDDLRHEREMNNDPDEVKKSSVKLKDSETGEAIPRGRRKGLDQKSEAGKRERRRSESGERDTVRTDKQPNRRSVFTLIRENTEFKQYREMEEKLAKERGEDPANENDTKAPRDREHNDTVSARTRATHQTHSSEATNSTDLTQSTDATQGSKKKEKISDIAKLVEIIEENNVAAAIKYIDVYAIKLLIKFQDEHPDDADKVKT